MFLKRSIEMDKIREKENKKETLCTVKVLSIEMFFLFSKKLNLLIFMSDILENDNFYSNGIYMTGSQVPFFR